MDWNYLNLLRVYQGFFIGAVGEHSGFQGRYDSWTDQWSFSGPFRVSSHACNGSHARCSHLPASCAPPKAVVEAYYAGFGPAVSGSFATFGWGWHLDTGIHALRMVLGGVFDLYPGLQIILGHWGEMIPFYLARFAEALTLAASQLQRPVADYFVQQMYATPSGMFTLPPFLLAMQVVGAERILYSVDYPFHFQEGGQARAFLENAPISPADKEKIAHSNAEGLLKL